MEKAMNQLKQYDVDTNLHYWITPPKLYRELDNEFHFEYDPCVYPKQVDTLVTKWGKMNYVNPPYRRKDGSPTAFVRKAIEEQQKGNSSVLLLPTQSYVNLLLDAGATAKSLGRVKWLSGKNRTEQKSPSPITLFHLRGKI